MQNKKGVLKSVVGVCLTPSRKGGGLAGVKDGGGKTLASGERGRGGAVGKGRCIRMKRRKWR